MRHGTSMIGSRSGTVLVLAFREDLFIQAPAGYIPCFYVHTYRRPKLTNRELDRINDLWKRIEIHRVGTGGLYLDCLRRRLEFERSMRHCMEFKITWNKSAQRNKILPSFQ